MTTFKRFSDDMMFKTSGIDPYLMSHPMPADRIASLMQDRLGARGTGLEAKLASCGRALPRKVRHAAKAVAEAAAN